MKKLKTIRNGFIKIDSKWLEKRTTQPKKTKLERYERQSPRNLKEYLNEAE